MNPSSAFASVLVDELIRGGVEEVVLAPGSRSAPLAYAFHAAAGAGRCRLHVRIDERGAGFLALGLAKTSGRPVPVVTTSGTAAANLHPAVIEASHAGVPLLLLTADRPPELRGSGANQTIDQVHLYGSAVRAFVEPGTPEERTGQHANWRALVCRAVAAAMGTLTADPGPVHLNLPLREPLVPDDDPSWPEFLTGRPGGAPWSKPERAEVAAPPYVGAPRTLVVVGDAPAEVAADAVRLADKRGWPLIAEPVTSARASGLSGGTLLLAMPDFLMRHLPERVLVAGRPTLSRETQALLRDPDVAVDVVVPGTRWADPAGVAATVLPAAVLRPPDGGPDINGESRGGQGGSEAELGRGDADFLAAWQKGAQAVASAVGTFLDLEPMLLTGLHVASVLADILAELPDPLLVLGSSNVVRDLALTGTGRGGSEVVTIANRGAAGIDGVVSTAVGAALAHGRATGTPAYALMGDLTFLHDSTALMAGPDEPQPDLTIVVVNDDGGGIFSTLEQGGPEHAASFERLFGTPTGVDLAHLCAAVGVSHLRLQIRDELSAALAWQPGLRVVEVTVSRGALPLLHTRLRDTVRATLADLD